MLYYKGKFYKDDFFRKDFSSKDMEFTEQFGNNPIFPIDKERFLVLAQYIPPTKEYKKDLSIFGKMTVAVCAWDETASNGVFRIKNFIKFGHESKDYRNGRPGYAFDNSFDVCWDYNVIYDLKLKDTKFLAGGLADPFYGLNRIGAYSNGHKKYANEKLFTTREAYEYFDEVDSKIKGYSEAFKEWATKYLNTNMDPQDYFMFYLTHPDGKSVATVTNNHWFCAYNEDIVSNNQYGNNIDKSILGGWMPFCKEKSFAIHKYDDTMTSYIYPLTNLIKYHFPALNTGDKTKNLRSLDHYKKSFLDNNFIKYFNRKSIADLQYED